MLRRISFWGSTYACVGWLCLLLCSPAGASTDGRAFEMVSPVFKAGYGATRIEAVGQSGGGVVYYSPGAFAGSPAGLTAAIDPLDYLARRNATGWTNVSLMAPVELLVYTETPDVDPSLDTVLLLGKQGTSVESAGQLGPVRSFYWHRTGMPDESAYWQEIGIPLEAVNHEREPVVYDTATPDFCRLIVSTNAQPLLTKAIGDLLPLYEVTSGCDGETPSLRLVNVDNKTGGGAIISKECATNLGQESYDPPSRNQFNAVSSDGTEVFFTTCVNDIQSDHQVFVRLDGARTLEVSQSLEEATKCGKVTIPCPGASTRASADFVGASTDGSRVYFTSTAELTGQTGDNSEKLYLADIGCPSDSECSPAERTVISLVQPSHNPNGGEAGVKGVVRTSPDGSHVYFMANGDLLTASQRTALEAEGEPVPVTGADNMYVYDAESGTTNFVAELCSGYEQSAAAVDPRCQSHSGSDESLILNNGATEDQTAGPDGRYLVFSSYAQLTRDDGDTARDVYRYDADTGALTRISGGENGYHSDGNGDAFDASINSGHHDGFLREQHEMDSRAISEDGTRIIFTTAEPLSKLASNGLTNVYEWHETALDAGSVSLLSGGSGSLPVEDAVMSPGGEDVFFVTSEGLVPEDVDGADDIYDARLGGGFPVQPAPPAECEGDGCYGALTNPAPLLIPGSVTQPPENESSQSSAGKKVSAKVKKTAKKAKTKRRSKKSNKTRKSARGARRHGIGFAATAGGRR